MLTIAHPLTLPSLNLAFVSAQITASAAATTIALPPCSFSAAPTADGAIPRAPAALHERFPANRSAPHAHSRATARSALESVCSQPSVEICFQKPAIA